MRSTAMGGTPRALAPRAKGARYFLLGCILLVAALAGCGTEKGASVNASPGAAPPAAKPAAGAESRPSEAPDLAAVMRRVRFAFRPEGDAFLGGDATYTVKASARGMSVTPHLPSEGRASPVQVGAPFVTEVESIARGEALVFHREGREGREGRAAVRDDASLGIERGAGAGAVEERLENTEEGVEQSFHFGAKPEGSGDLTVSIAVSGEAFTGQTPLGLHFADPETGLGVRYGNGTWIDARGERTPVSVAYHDGRIELRVPEGVIEASAYPAVLDPVVGPELGTDNPVYGPAKSDQVDPVVSFGGGNYLVVWVDYRYSFGSSSTDIYGVRVSPAGTVLDTSGIPIAVAKGNQYRPAVAHDGTSWMVAWSDSRAAGYDIYAARVSAAGENLDPNGIAVATGGGKDLPSISSDGANFFIAYMHSNTSLRGTFVAPNGTVNPAFVAVATAPNGVYETAVGYNGTNYLVAFHTFGTNFYRLAARRVTPGGTVLEASDILACDSSNNCGYSKIGIASDGVNWLLAWKTQASNSTIYGQRISSAGVRLDATSGFVVGVGVQSGATSSVSVVFVGNGFGVFWDDGQNVFGARVSSGAAILIPGTALTTEAGSRVHPGVAYDGTNFFAVFSDTRLANTLNGDDIFGLRVTPALVKVDAASVLLSRAGNDQNRPRAAFNGTNYLVVWEDWRPGTSHDIWGARVSKAGAVLDASGIAISQAAGNQMVPSVVANGSDWLVVWQDGRAGSGVNDDIYAARVLANGTAQDPMGIAVSSAPGHQQTPAVAADGTNYTVVWRDTTSGDIWLARVSPAAGAVLDMSGVKVSTGGGSSPSIAYSGTNYLVAWSKATNAGDIFGSRVTPAGVVLDSGALAIPVSAVVGAAEVNPSVASNGSDFLVAWNDASDVKAARVNAAGTVVDVVGITVAAAANTQSLPTAAWDGTQYWVAWQDDRTTSTYADVYAARIGTNGAVKDAGGFTVATDALQNELRPALAAGGLQELLIVYYRYDPAQPFGSDRVRARVLSDVAPGANGAACVVGAQCVSTFCVDGVCCDATCAGSCQACSAAKKGAGADGVCGPVKVATDPDNECADQGALSCGTNGSCNGSGACQLYASGTTCGSMCVGGATQPKACDGSGACANSGASTSCAPYTCDAATGACKGTCVVNGDCAPGFSCMGGACVGLLGNGSACSNNAECQSGFCADGVCCNTACPSLCQACSAAKKGVGADGTCGPIVAGNDPDNECSTDAISTCDKTGACSGSGTCQLYASGTSCGGPICQGNVLKGQACDGAGTCNPAAMGQDCSPYACSNGACLGACVGNNDCAAPFVCVAGSCTSPIVNGGACLSGAQCQSGSCVDGVCCDTACTGLCVACTVAKKGGGTDGVCGPVGAGSDPDNECVAQASMSCGQTGACSGSGACQLYAQGTSCGASLCQGSVVTGQICNGMGQCTQDAVGQDCAPYVCSGGACKNPCANSNECLAGYVCTAGACQLAGSPGSPCAGAAECASNFCVDGVCCDAACSGACVACSTAKKGQGADGACGPIKNGSDPDNECAGQAPSTCKQNGQCNGMGACGLHPAGTQCAAGACNGTTETMPSQCDGLGMCVTGAQAMCVEGYACVGNKCSTSCANNSDCAPGYSCDVAMQWCVPEMSGAGGSGMGGSGMGGSGMGGSGMGGSGMGGSGEGGKGMGGSGMGGSGEGGKGSSAGGAGMGGDTGEGGGATSGSGGRPDGSGGDTGCGCRTVGDGSSSPVGAGALLMLAALAGARRRRLRPAA